ncbi:nectin-3-like protein isoform X2 [Cynoglossus semilaevis]|uniref:nectin-3-like protein isoform X2 n=1 Tax=Cynoglossus semilaevis TaxID=244447 RepID=UPI0007DCAEAD|nr:nectin-3-like protein isoform X2 [Cynoglossus semilaevis]
MSSASERRFYSQFGLFHLLCSVTGMWGSQVLVPHREGISIPPEFGHRLYFRSPSSHDATIVLEKVGFADVGIYTCKVATFPMGNAQASTTVTVFVEPKVYVSASSTVLIDGGNKTLVATCVAEGARPPAEVSWESNLIGQSEVQLIDEVNGTTTTQVRYLWQPTRNFQGHAVTCVIRHPALQSDFRIPYLLNVQFAPDISVVGYDGDWYVGRENVRMTCRANANPPAHHFRWIRLDGKMPQGVKTINSTLLFLRALKRNDSGVYRCEVANDISLRSRDVRILIRDPPTVSSTITAPLLTGSASSVLVNERDHVLLSSPTLKALPERNHGSIMNGAVGGALFLLLLLFLVGACYLWKQQSLQWSYYTKKYQSNVDLQKPPTQPELHATKSGKSASRHRDHDREEWGDCQHKHKREHNFNSSHNGDNYTVNGYTRAVRESTHHGQQHNQHQEHLQYSRHAKRQEVNAPPFLLDDDSVPDGDFVSHTDGSVISRKEWYV